MKFFVKLLTAAAAIVCFVAPQAGAFGTKPEKRIEDINSAYTNYTHAYTTMAPNKSAMLKQLEKVCNANCKAGVGKIGGTCSNTKLREACAKRCPSVTTKRCLAKYKETQGMYLTRDKRKLDEDGVPMSPTAMKKVHDKVSGKLVKERQQIIADHTAHVGHKAATAQDRTQFRKDARKRTEAVHAKPVKKAKPVVMEEDEAILDDADSTAETDDAFTDDELVQDEEEEEVVVSAPVRRASMKRAAPQVVIEEVEDDSQIETPAPVEQNSYDGEMAN